MRSAVFMGKGQGRFDGDLIRATRDAVVVNGRGDVVPPPATPATGPEPEASAPTEAASVDDQSPFSAPAPAGPPAVLEAATAAPAVVVAAPLEVSGPMLRSAPTMPECRARWARRRSSYVWAIGGIGCEVFARRRRTRL